MKENEERGDKRQNIEPHKKRKIKRKREIKTVKRAAKKKEKVRENATVEKE